MLPPPQKSTSKSKQKEQAFADRIYGKSVAEVVSEHVDLLVQSAPMNDSGNRCSETARKELIKCTCAELAGVPEVYLEYRP